MPLYEVPVYVKVAAESAAEARRYLYDTDALDSLRTRGMRDTPVDPEARQLRGDEVGVGGFVCGQPVRLEAWNASQPYISEGQIVEPPGQRVKR